jgi:Tfp pilus assembly protein PilF
VSRKKKARRREVVPERERLQPVARSLTQRWVLWLVPVLIGLVTFAVFLPALHNQFVNWDDADNFLDNPHYRGLVWTQLRWMWTTTHMGHYIPLTWMTLGLDYLLWGMNPFGYHLTNLLLHAANAVVFFFIARRLLTLALPSLSEHGHALALSAGFAALVFAIHPLRVESVAWVTERRDVLSGLFYLLAILVYLRACEPERRGRWWYCLSVAVFVCALLSKSMVVNLPVVLVILDVYPLRRLGGAIGWWSEPARRVYVEKIPLVLLAAAVSAIALMAQVSLRAMVPVAHLSVLGRLAVSAYGLSFYLWKTVVPVNLSPLYELPPTMNPWAMPFILSCGVVVAITALALALRRRVPGLPAAWAVYIVVLLPVLGLFQSGQQIAADRYTYLATLGWAMLGGAALLSYRRRLPFLSIGLVAFVVIGLGTRTWNQVQFWHDSEKLWTHALFIDPKSSVAHFSLGLALAKNGKPTEAIDHYRQALQIKPNYAEAHTSWGLALAQQGKLAEAIDHYRQTLHTKPDSADAHNNWGLALAQQGKLAEAIDHYRQAIQIEPDHAQTQYNWGNALVQQGKPAEASEHYQQALQIRPNYAAAHTNWGVALAQQGKPAEAIDHYRQALRIKPDSAEAHANWGLALADQGKLAEAIDHYRLALQIKPDSAEVHINWGTALADQGKLAEASEHYRQALRLEPDHAAAQSNLLNVLRRQGTGKEEAAHRRKGEKAD